MSEIFFDLVDRVEQSGKFQEILKTQHIKYQLHPFKIHGIDCQAIKKTYESIQDKYHNSSELTHDPNNWNENERRVFIWFIIFYTYFKDINSTEIKQSDWQIFSKTFFNKNPKFLQFQLLNMVKPYVKVTWTREQDEALIKAVQEEVNWRWNEVAKSLFYNSDCTIFKSPKHCRERWLNHLDDKKKRGLWTPQEDLKIFKFVMDFGKRWCKLVSVLKDTRTEHMIKNRYNSLINKQRKSRKEREEQLSLKIIKQLKKQISNGETKKKTIETDEKKETKLEDLTPEQKIVQENLNTKEKDEKSNDEVKLSESQGYIMANEEIRHSQSNDENQYPFYNMSLIDNTYYQMVSQQPYYGYSYMPVPEVPTYGFPPMQPMQPMQNYYWM